MTAATKEELCLAKLDDIIVAISIRSIVPSAEVVDYLLDLRQMMS